MGRPAGANVRSSASLCAQGVSKAALYRLERELSSDRLFLSGIAPLWNFVMTTVLSLHAHADAASGRCTHETNSYNNQHAHAHAPCLACLDVHCTYTQVGHSDF